MGYYANRAAVELADKAFRKWHYLAPVCAGAAAFGISQLLIRIPILNQILPNFEWYLTLPYTSPILYGLFLAFTAGLFEETARRIGFGILGNRYRGFGDGIAFGIGHGGLEVLYVLWMVIQQVLKGFPVSPLGLAVTLLERAGAMGFHIGASVMVLYGVCKKQKRWLFLAILLHTLLDLCAVLLTNLWLTEAIVLIFGAGFLAWAVQKRKTWPDNEKLGGKHL
ncbi:MAG: YhfC family glutamic-type intramembrane protease [Eubacteriales bacterium]|nr:YhfC family glutamic-type intramembrane protease [Eubacteriales bacterium]